MKKVIIFCANGYGELVLNSINEEIIEIVAFADNDPRKWGKMCAGRPIISPENISDLEFDKIIIAYAEYADSIKEQLLSRGVDCRKISIFQDSADGIAYSDNRIALMRKCASIINERRISGSVAEVGVYRGDFSRLINRYFPDRTMYLFDTFDGFNDKDLENENLSVTQKQSFKKTSEQFVLSRMFYPNKCIVRKGWFPETAQNIDDTFCFVSLDADLYNPIKSGLEFFYPRMEKGGYIFVHDFGTMDWSGAKKAVYEFCDEQGVSFFPLLDRALSAVIVK